MDVELLNLHFFHINFYHYYIFYYFIIIILSCVFNVINIIAL